MCGTSATSAAYRSVYRQNQFVRVVRATSNVHVWAVRLNTPTHRRSLKDHVAPRLLPPNSFLVRKCPNYLQPAVIMISSDRSCAPLCPLCTNLMTITIILPLKPLVRLLSLQFKPWKSRYGPVMNQWSIVDTKSQHLWLCSWSFV